METVSTATIGHVPSVLHFRHCRVDLQRRQVLRGDATLRLSANEAALLQVLAERTGEAVSRDELLVAALEYRPGVTTRAVDHAMSRLRNKIELDPKAPEHLLTVHGVGYVMEGLRTRAEPPGDRFFGRDGVLRELRSTLEGPCLLTITGPGGVGKTRLLRELARDRDDVLLCPLRAARGRHDMLEAVGEALDTPLSPLGEEARVAQLGRVLASRGAIVLALDNVEQLVDSCRELIDAWRSAAPELRIVVTSQRRLDLPGERCISLPPLPRSAAVELFIDRAQRRGAVYEPDAGERGLLQKLVVERLDGLPLAIELAASRSGLLTPRDLLDQLGGGLGDAISWSWDLLPESVQRAFAGCSVFAGSFDVPRCEAVLGRPVVDALEELQSRSLLHRAEDVDGRARFQLLTTARDFARERLSSAPDAAGVRRRHWRWFVDQAEQRRDDALLRGELDWHARERPDLLAAVEHAAADGAPHGARAALAVDPLLRARGPLDLRADLLDRARGGLTDADEALWLELSWRLADAWRLLGQPYEELSDEMLRRAESLDDLRLRGVVVGCAGAFALARGEFELGEELFVQAIALHETVRNRRSEAIARFNLGTLLEKAGRGVEAEQSYRAALRAAEQAGDRGVRAAVFSGLGVLCFERGRLQEASELLHKALESQDHRGYALYFGSNLGHMELAAGRYDDAESHLADVADRAAAWGELDLVADANHGLALADLGRGRADAAIQGLDAARRMYRELGRTPFEGQADLYTGVALLLQGRCREARSALCAGRDILATSQASALATASCFLAVATARAGEVEAALELLARASTEADASDTTAAALIRICRAAVEGRGLSDALSQTADVAARNLDVRLAARVVKAPSAGCDTRTGA